MPQYANESDRSLYLSPNVDTGPVTYTDVNTGKEVTTWAAGANGPFFSNAEATMTGLYLRKYLDPDRELKDIGEGKSDQPFILMRYAEVLLAAAEAGVELAISGQPSPLGDDMLQVATDAIRDIQNRAGAVEITEKLTATNASRDIVRKERRKELAFEQKSKWDIRRQPRRFLGRAAGPHRMERRQPLRLQGPVSLLFHQGGQVVFRHLLREPQDLQLFSCELLLCNSWRRSYQE